MVSHQADPLSPELYDILQFIRHLFSICTSPQTVRNRISGAKLWVEGVGGDAAPFTERVIAQTLKGGARAAAHAPRRAPAITPEMMMQIADFLDRAGPAGVSSRAALLIGFFSMIRQSNLLSPSTRSWGGPHTLRRRDVRRVEGGLRLDIRSSKTIHLVSDATSLFVPRVRSRHCPVQAWEASTALSTGGPDDPAFMTYSGVPLTPYSLTRVMRAAISSMGVLTPEKYTLHGLRRGAAQTCQNMQVDIRHIMAHGTWKSSAVKSYTITPAPKEAPVALAKCFG